MENRFISVDWPAFTAALRQQGDSADHEAADEVGAATALFDEEGENGPLFEQGGASELPRSAASSPLLQADVGAVIRALPDTPGSRPCMGMLKEICLGGIDLPRRQDLPELEDRLSDVFAAIAPATIQRWLGSWNDDEFAALRPALARAVSSYDTGLVDPKPSDRVSLEHVLAFVRDWIAMLRQASHLRHGIIWFMG